MASTSIVVSCKGTRAKNFLLLVLLAFYRSLSRLNYVSDVDFFI